MPEKEKTCVSKSKSLQEINKECVGNKINRANNIFERQVDGENSCEPLTYYCDRHDEVKTLPTANKSNGFYFLGRSNQLKRPAIWAVGTTSSLILTINKKNNQQEKKVLKKYSC